MKLGSVLWLGAAPCTILATQTSALLAAPTSINPSVTTPVYPKFSSVSYRFNTMSSKIVWCWVRFPGATASDIYEVLNGNRA